MPGQDLGLDSAEGVGIADGKLDTVLFSGAGDDFEDDGAAGGCFEAPFPGCFEGDCAGCRGDGLDGRSFVS